MYIGVIEDSPAVLKVIKAILVVHGHHVEEHRDASSFFIALQKAARIPSYDLVIVDLFLDGGVGTEVIAALNSFRPQPIASILMSAAAPSIVEPIKARYPEQAFLQKPFKISSLLALIEQVAAPGKRASELCFSTSQP